MVPPPRAHQRTHQLVRPRLRSSMMGLIVEVASGSKNHQKVKKPQRPKKLQRSSVWRNVYQSTNPSSIWYKKLKLPLEHWQFSRLFLLGLGALSISALIISKTRLIEPLILCHVFLHRSQDKKKILRHFGHLLFEFNPATPSSYRCCARPSSLLQFWRCAPEEDILIQGQFDGGEDVEGVVHYQGLSYIPEIIRTELTTEKTREFVARKYYRDLQLFPIPTRRRKGTSYNLILVIINRLTRWEDLSMDLQRIAISTNWKGINYNLTLVIVGLHNKQVPNAPGLAGVFIPIYLIVSDRDSICTSKFWSLVPLSKLDCGYHLRVIYKNIN